ncbi:hypothetical protein [Paenibacillus donghaensis]|uniref:Inhibitor of growth protein N-terminal histone-binding domain-containing protein n=1 Tax=Paenibacillus donghaensis TaxID=414771 RepID=A0A2Z2KCY2_9BACL|nr:hypothetical protein [Paenibacillus donghaensis]ASA23507.1 hypothetical protein B9T62_23525 [Paenibacillus donghaensis]
MRKSLFTGLIVLVMVLSACSSNEPEAAIPASDDEVQESVMNFYNEISRIEQSGKSSLEDFNAALSSYSAGEVSAKQLKKAIKQFQKNAANLTEETADVEIVSGLPENIRKLLVESIIAFQSAYSLKEEASKSADSPNVSPEQFNKIIENADVAMLFGISKLNEARVASGLIEPDSTTTTEGGSAN